MKVPQILSSVTAKFAGPAIVLDCGSAMTKLAYKGKLLVTEPTVVAIEQQSGQFVTIGDEARKQHAVGSAKITLIRPIKRGRIVDQVAFQYFLTTLLTKVTWHDGSPLPAASEVIFITWPELEPAAKAQWRQLVASLGRPARISSTLSVLTQLGSNVEDRSWLIDFGASHIGCTLKVGDRFIEQVSIPWGTDAYLRVIERVIQVQDIRLSEAQLESVLEQVVSIQVTKTQNQRKRKASFTAKLQNSSSVSQVVIQEDSLNQAVDRVTEEWLWAMRQALLQLVAGAELQSSPESVYVLGGGARIKNVVERICSELLLKPKQLPGGNDTIATALSKYQYEK